MSREGGTQLNVVDLIVGDVSLSVNLPSISAVSLACRSIMATAFLASATPWSVSVLLPQLLASFLCSKTPQNSPYVGEKFRAPLFGQLMRFVRQLLQNGLG